MADGKQQKCRNGCGTNIYVSDRTGKWLPYNWGTDNKHDCPNYKKKITPQESTDTLALLLDVKESLVRIEELLEATLKNLGLFKTAKDEGLGFSQ